jgi:hypothetical protein
VIISRDLREAARLHGPDVLSGKSASVPENSEGAVRCDAWSVVSQQPGWRRSTGCEPSRQRGVDVPFYSRLDERPCRVHSALDLQKAGREPSSRSSKCCAPCSSPRSTGPP